MSSSAWRNLPTVKTSSAQLPSWLARRIKSAAALLAGRIDISGKNVVIVLSGGNVDADLFAKLVA